jgi:geranylgeranyl reductase family protein
MSDLYDVIILGAGPGGATAAFYLGKAGKKVLVLEKETLPRYKTCGGGISANLLAQFPFDFDEVIETRVKTITYILNDKEVSFPVPEDTVQMVMRSNFDSYILAHANAEVRQGETAYRLEEQEDRVVVLTKTGEVFEGQFLIAADGANSIAHRTLGLRRGKTLAAGIEVEVPVLSENMSQWNERSVFIFGEVRLGYLWIFPKSNHLSVGIGALHPKPGELQAVLDRVMRRFGISLEGTRQHGHPLPLYTRKEKLNTDRILLVGDAAGLVDPFSGEGIRYAVKSGRIAAEVILTDNLVDYNEIIYQKIGRSHRLAAGLALLFYRFPRLCFVLGVQNPFATQVFIDMFSDRTSYLGLILRLFASLPFYLGIESLAFACGFLLGPRGRQNLRTRLYKNKIQRPGINRLSTVVYPPVDGAPRKLPNG